MEYPGSLARYDPGHRNSRFPQNPLLLSIFHGNGIDAARGNEGKIARMKCNGIRGHKSHDCPDSASSIQATRLIAPANLGSASNSPCPGVEYRNAGWRKVIHIARHDSHAMNQCCRCDQSIADRPGVGNMELCATLRDSNINY